LGSVSAAHLFPALTRLEPRERFWPVFAGGLG